MILGKSIDDDLSPECEINDCMTAYLTPENLVIVKEALNRLILHSKSIKKINVEV